MSQDPERANNGERVRRLVVLPPRRGQWPRETDLHDLLSRELSKLVPRLFQAQFDGPGDVFDAEDGESGLGGLSPLAPRDGGDVGVSFLGPQREVEFGDVLRIRCGHTVVGDAEQRDEFGLAEFFFRRF